MAKEIYNGNSVPLKTNGTPRQNRAVKGRGKSSISILAIIVVVSFMIVGYIWNKICVNRLVVEVNDLNNLHEKMVNENGFLLAEINKKSSLERIEKKILTDKLELVSPREQPIWFEFDDTKLDQLNRTEPLESGN
ncbi:MAG: hypothetical protein HZB59_13285 [Ignavibacteriales bacterium]|nr:hypothetical protein [Ignavibacteriales bacterium]